MNFGVLVEVYVFCFGIMCGIMHANSFYIFSFSVRFRLENLNWDYMGIITSIYFDLSKFIVQVFFQEILFYMFI